MKKDKFLISFFIIGLLIFFLTLLVFLNIIKNLKDVSFRTNKEISENSEKLIPIIKNYSLNLPKHLFQELLKEGEFTKVLAIGIFLGNKKISSIPDNFNFPPFSEPPISVETISYVSFGKRLFLKKLEDGKTLLILYEVNEYKRVFLNSFFNSILTLFFLFLSLTTVYITFKKMKDFSTPMQEKLEPLKPIEAIELFKKTIKELQEKNVELEAELRKERKKIKSSSQVLENLCSGLNAGFIRFDKEGNLITFNPLAKNLLGIPVLFQIGENFKKIFLSKPELFNFLESSYENREISTLEGIKGFKDNYLSFISIPILDEYNRFEGILLIVQDKSEFFKIQKILKEKEALYKLGEVAAGVAHEIRNGLNVLQGELRLLKLETKDKEIERFSRIENEIYEMERVLKDLLFYSKPLNLNIEEIETLSFLNDLINTLKENFKNVKISFDVEVEKFYGDKSSLTRAIYNILINSVEAMEKEGEIYINVQKRDGKIIFHTEDSGKGIDEKIKDEIFNLFTSFKKGGTGLGLKIAKKIAMEHDGDLIISKSTKLKGASFDFIIKDIKEET